MIPAGITRAPTLMASQVFLSNISRSSVSLLNVQEQLATGLRVNRFSDDPIRATGITVVQSSLSRHEQRLKNLGHAQGVLDQLDLSVADASELVLEGKGIASDQIGPGSDAVTRKNQSLVIDAMVRRLFDLSNRSTRGVYFFGGSTPASPPVLEVEGGYRYVGQGAGLSTDLGLGDSFTITLGGDNAIGEVSARHRGLIDLDPGLTLDTPLDDVRGTAGVGVRTGEVSFSFNGGESRTVDLTGSVRVGDVVDRIATALAAYETEFGVTILPPPPRRRGRLGRVHHDRRGWGWWRRGS